MSDDNNNSNQDVYIDIGSGAGIIVVGAIIFIALHLYRRKRKAKRDIENEQAVGMEETDTISNPKKTAADHLEEIKATTQKVLQPLRNSRSSLSFSKRASTTSLNLSNLTKSSNDTKISGTSSRPKSQYGSGIGTLVKSLQKRTPPPPPPTPLKAHFDDDISEDPIRMSLLNALLSDETSPQSCMSQTQSNESYLSTSQLDLKRSALRNSQSPVKRPETYDVKRPKTNDVKRPNVKRPKTNDYTNFQPIQNIRPTPAVKKEFQDDEVILDAT